MTQNSLLPPTAKTVPFSFTQHGHTIEDPYSWLQNKADPEVIAYLEAENAYASAWFASSVDLEKQIYQEMRSRIQEDDWSVPEQHGDWLYFWRMKAGQQYRQFYRSLLSGGPEQLLLDENKLAEGKVFTLIHIFQPSPDNRLLAYSVDTNGSLVYDMYIMDMQTGEVVAGPIQDTAWTAGWASDSRTLFYTVFNACHRPHRLDRYQVDLEGKAGKNQNSQTGEPVYQEIDDAFNITIRRTRTGAYLLMTIFSGTTSEVRYLPADRPLEEFTLIHPRQHWMEYYVEHSFIREQSGGQSSIFLIRTNDAGAVNYKLMRAPASNPAKEHWQEILSHREDVMLDGTDVFRFDGTDAFRDFLVLYERRDGLQQIRITAPGEIASARYIHFPEPVYTFHPGNNPEFNTTTLRIAYSSLVTPNSIVDIDLGSGAWEVKKQQKVPSGYDESQYESKRLFAIASDGARVPISLVYKKGIRHDGSAPLLLEGYGSYGYSHDPDFDPKRLSLLDRGFVFAIAHIRGGSELGRRWYEDGRLMHKKNTFTDFIACADYLVSQGYTSPDRLGAHGASAGGLLMSAIANLRPDLFKAIIARVPFTNVITAMLDPDLPLTVIEWEQWGNPANPQEFEYMLSYSPYENVKSQAYPALLVKTGLNDLQVPYWDPAKWVARLRACKTDTNPLLLITNMGAGHRGASGRYDHLHEDAQMYSFLILTLAQDKR